MVLVNFYPKSRLNCIKTMLFFALFSFFLLINFLAERPPKSETLVFSTISFRFQEYFFYSKSSPAKIFSVKNIPSKNLLEITIMGQDLRSVV
jgi:hypothetical protein